MNNPQQIDLIRLTEIFGVDTPNEFWFADDCEIDEYGIKPKPIDQNAMKLLCWDEWREVEKFRQDICLMLPCSLNEFKAWAERNDIADSLPQDVIESVTLPTEQIDKLKALEVDAAFKEFEKLRPNEVSFVVSDSSIKVVVRGKTIRVSSQQLGFKVGSQSWKIFEGAAVTCGDLSAVLKKLNKTSDLEKEQARIKTAVSRLRTKLINSMGLINDPIAFQENSGYKFIFKSISHALLHGDRVTKSADAMDYIDDSRNSDGEFYGDDES